MGVRGGGRVRVRVRVRGTGRGRIIEVRLARVCRVPVMLGSVPLLSSSCHCSPEPGSCAWQRGSESATASVGTSCDAEWNNCTIQG